MTERCAPRHCGLRCLSRQNRPENGRKQRRACVRDKFISYTVSLTIKRKLRIHTRIMYYILQCSATAAVIPFHTQMKRKHVSM